MEWAASHAVGLFLMGQAFLPCCINGRCAGRPNVRQDKNGHERQSIFQHFVDWPGLVSSSSSACAFPGGPVSTDDELCVWLGRAPCPSFSFSQNGSKLPRQTRTLLLELRKRMTHRQIRRGVCISLTHDCDVLGYFIYIYNNISFLPDTRCLTNQIRAHLFPKIFHTVLIKSNLQT